MEKIIIGNLKMNILTTAERDRYLESFEKESAGASLDDVAIVLCVPAVHIEKFAEKIKDKNGAIGAQNIFWEERGSYTGEVSPQMVKNFGADYAIIGHSERRKYFGETNEQANEKIKAALKAGLSPIYCVGETKEDREAGIVAEVIVEQISKGLSDVSSLKVPSAIIAYEPVWAVGSDEVPTSDQILEIKILIRKILTQLYGAEVAEKVKVLYGGSVNAKTAEQVCNQSGMDGALIGRESLIPNEFFKIAKIIDNK